MYPINVVEKETSISKYLLRMWERRYSFPRPGRDQKGERVYTNEDLEKLKLVKALMEEGYRPSKIIDQSLDELRELSKSFGIDEDGHKDADKDEVVVLVTSEFMEADLQEALKNHKVKRIVRVSTPEDIKNLAL